MQSVQAMHEYMLRHLMTLFAVTLQAIHVWNVFKVQISIQIYAFNFDMHCKNAFCFLKIIMHFYHLIAQMQSLCWDAIFVLRLHWCLRRILCTFLIVDFINLCDTVLLWCYRLLKSLWRRKCIICISTVSSHLLK